MCAELAAKMRKKMLDEDLPDVRLHVKSQINRPASELGPLVVKDNLAKYLQEKVVTQANGVPLKTGENYLEAGDFGKLDLKENGTVLDFDLRKHVLKILFPEGHKLKDVKLNEEIEDFPSRSQCPPIEEDPTEIDNYIEDRPSMMGTQKEF